MTFNRLALTKQYARGNESPKERITSAIQIVADLETPTRQWTSVAVPFALPRSMRTVRNGSFYERGWLTYEFQAPLKLLGQRVNTVVLYPLYNHYVIVSPSAQFSIFPNSSFSYAKNLSNSHLP